MLYALTQPERELLSNRYGTRTTQHKCTIRQWAISNNGFRSDSLYEKKIGEDLVFDNALPKSLTINTSRVSKGKTKIA